MQARLVGHSRRKSLHQNWVYWVYCSILHVRVPSLKNDEIIIKTWDREEESKPEFSTHTVCCNYTNQVSVFNHFYFLVPFFSSSNPHINLTFTFPFCIIELHPLTLSPMCCRIVYSNTKHHCLHLLTWLSDFFSPLWPHRPTLCINYTIGLTVLAYLYFSGG